MSHKFDRRQTDPYTVAAHHLEGNLFRGTAGEQAGAAEGLYDVLSNAVVTSLGDIMAQAFRYGVNDPGELQGLARAIARTAETVCATYVGEVDPEPALDGIATDSRIGELDPVSRNKLASEIAKTRELETLLLKARRLPDLIDYAGSLGLHVDDELLDQGTVLLSVHPTPNPADQ